MTIQVPGSEITLATTSPALSATFTITDFKYIHERQPFQRGEFLGDRLRSAKNIDGSTPVYWSLSGNRPVQFFTNCNPNETERPLDPDDARIDNIYWRWDITRFYISADANDNPNVVDIISSLAKSHQGLLAEFDVHIEIGRSADVSFPFLVAMQSESFSYLTTSTLTIGGDSSGEFAGSTNLLITKFQGDVEYDDKIYGSDDVELMSSFTLEIEKRILRSARTATF